MWKFLSKYHILDVLFFIGLFLLYASSVAPDITWMSLGADSIDYVPAAKYMLPGGLTGYPTYILVGWLFERLPFGDFYNLGLLSSVALVVTCLFIFLTVKYFIKTKEDFNTSPRIGLESLSTRIAPYFAALVFASAFLVWSLAQIPKPYIFTCMLMSGGLYFVLVRKYYIAAIFFALCLGSHYMSFFLIVACLLYIYLKERNWKLLVKLVCIGSLGLLIYLQVFLTRPINLDSTNGFTQTLVILGYTVGGLGTLPIVPFSATLERVYEVVTISLVSIGFSVPLLFYVRWNRETKLIGFTTIAVFVFYFTAYFWQWITYLVFTYLFIAILVGIGMIYFPYRKWSWVFLIPCIAFLVLNFTTYRIGYTLDIYPSTARQLYNEISNLRNSDIVISPIFGQPALVVQYYSIENKEGPILVSYSKVVFKDRYPNYYSQLEKLGVKLPLLKTEKPSFDTELENFVKEVQTLNPERRVYVVYLKKGQHTEMVYSLISAYDYSNSSNDFLPRSLVYNEGGL